MTVIRPVLTVLPALKSTLEEEFGNVVPMSYVVLPFGRDADAQEEESEEEEEMIGFQLWKCRNCGAIHNPCSKRVNDIQVVSSSSDSSKDYYLCRICFKFYDVPKVSIASSVLPKSRSHSCVDYTLSISHPSPPPAAAAGNDDDDMMPYVSWSMVLDGRCLDASYWTTVTSALSSVFLTSSSNNSSNNNNNEEEEELPPMAVSIWVLTADGGVSLWNSDGSYTAHYSNLDTIIFEETTTENFVRQWYHTTLYPSLFRTLNDPATWKHFLSLYHTSPSQQQQQHGMNMTHIIQTIVDLHSNNNNNNNNYQQHTIWLFPSTTTPQSNIPPPVKTTTYTQQQQQQHPVDNYDEDNDDHPLPTSTYAAYYDANPNNHTTNTDTAIQQHSKDDEEESYRSSSSSCTSDDDSYDDGDPSTLLDFYEKLHVNYEYLELISKLGYDCNQTSTNVQFCFIRPTTTTTTQTNHSNNSNNPNLGLMYWEALCDETGGELRTFSTNTQYSQQERLKDYLLSQRQMMRYFNVKMRVLCSNSIQYNPTLQYWHKHQQEHEQQQLGEANHNVRILGHCRTYTTCCIDLEPKQSTLSSTFGNNDIIMSPCMQLQVAYTQIIYDPNASSWKPVRKLRVTTIKLPTTKYLHLPSLGATTETLLNAIDMEALAVTMFHHIHNSAYNEGWSVIRPLAQDWLVSILVAIYHSAEYFHQFQKQHPYHSAVKRLSDHFYAESRLLPSTSSNTNHNHNYHDNDDDDGDKHPFLFDKHILLAQGHEGLSSLTLLMFGLLQCHAFWIDTESRWMDISLMKSMPPSALARALAPRLELWNGKEVLEQHLPLSLEDLRLKMEQYYDPDTNDNDDDDDTMILFLDSPQQIMVLAHPTYLLCSHHHHHHTKTKKKQPSKQTMSDGNNNHPNNTPDSSLLLLSPELRHAIDEAVKSYPMAPPVEYCLDTADFQKGIKLLKRAMVKDRKLVRSKTTHSDGQPKVPISYNQWTNRIAKLVYSCLMQENQSE